MLQSSSFPVFAFRSPVFRNSLDLHYHTIRPSRPDDRTTERINLPVIVPSHSFQKKSELSIIIPDPEFANLPCAQITVKEPAQRRLRTVVIAKHILPHEIRPLLPAIDESSNHRRPFIVIVLQYRIAQPRRQSSRVLLNKACLVEFERPFLQSPAVVLPALDPMHPLEPILPDLPHPSLVSVAAEQ